MILFVDGDHVKLLKLLKVPFKNFDSNVFRKVNRNNKILPLIRNNPDIKIFPLKLAKGREWRRLLTRPLITYDRSWARHVSSHCRPWVSTQKYHKMHLAHPKDTGQGASDWSALPRFTKASVVYSWIITCIYAYEYIKKIYVFYNSFLLCFLPKRKYPWTTKSKMFNS